jgi:hypothetical protein
MEGFSAQLQSMIDQAGTLTAEQIEGLGSGWASIADYAVLPDSRLTSELATNTALIDAWQRAVDAAGASGRVEEIDAARTAGRTAEHAARRARSVSGHRGLVDEAVRAAVLAVGVKDLLSAEDYALLVGPWRAVLGGV